jgi:hypothetical protein
MVYDPRLANQWSADAIKGAVNLISEIRIKEGFEGRYVSPEYIKQCILDDMMARAGPAGVA